MTPAFMPNPNTANVNTAVSNEPVIASAGIEVSENEPMAERSNANRANRHSVAVCVQAK